MNTDGGASDTHGGLCVDEGRGCLVDRWARLRRRIQKGNQVDGLPRRSTINSIARVVNSVLASGLGRGTNGCQRALRTCGFLGTALPQQIG